MNRYSTKHLRVMFLIGFCQLAVGLSAADVRLQVASDTETYVGMPVVVNVVIGESKDHQPPDMKPIDGLDIQRSGPSTSSQISITSDRSGTRRIETSSYVYTFTITPTRVGKFTIPPIKVVADGIASVTKAITISATESETGDLLRVEVDANRESVYVGEPLEVTLRILVKCFSDEKLGIQLSEGSMWNLIRPESQWGFFADRMAELRENRQRPGGEIVSREDDDGNRAEYFAYEIDATIYPKRAGKIDGGDVNVIVNYPVSIGPTESPFQGLSSDLFRQAFGRGMFGSRMQINKVRPVGAGAKVASVEVKPIPKVGRPDDYRGAVGRYKIITEASPRSCQSGDPIQLDIIIDGTGPMELVRAPALAELDAFTDDFKVSDEPLAGVVTGKRKTFSTTIRPKNEKVTSIPAIPYTYFDPDSEQFVTVESEPIVVYIDKAETLSLDAVAGKNTPRVKSTDRNRNEAESADKQRELSEIPEVASLMRPQRPAKLLSKAYWSLLLVPPGLALLSQFVMRRRQFASLTRRIVPAERQFLRGLAKATSRDEIANTLQNYLSRLTGSGDRYSAIGQLRATQRSNAAVQAERVYAECDASHHGRGDDHEFIEKLKNDALQIITSLKTDSQNRRYVQNRLSGQSAKRVARLVGWTLLAVGFHQTANANDGLQLSKSQIQVLLTEARNALISASDSQGKDATEQYAVAAEKLRTVIDSGLTNAALHYNAGRAYAGSGQRGHAVAAYARALRIEPTNHRYRQALRQTQPSQPPTNAMQSRSQRWLERARDVRRQAIAIIPLKIVFAIFAVSWIAFWVLLTLRSARRIESFWLYVSTAAFIAVVSGWVYSDTVYESTQAGTAVLLSTQAELRQGDDAMLPVVATLTDSQGMVVEELTRRGGWVQIRAGDRTGWLPESELDSV